jgi:DNA-binding GntR family transcriptional regulator
MPIAETRPRRARKEPDEVPHGARSDHTYLQLRDSIVRGELAPSTRLGEAECAVRLGVSRTPVRDALNRLRREGFVVAVTNGRRAELAVASLDPAAVSDLWMLSASIEGIAVSAVATMSRGERHALAAELEETNEQLARAVTPRKLDLDLVGVLMSQFHEVLMQACGRGHLSVVHDALRPHIQRFERAYGSRGGANYRASIREHEDIIAAIRRGNAGMTRRLLEGHWNAGLSRTIEHLRLRGGSPVAVTAAR